MVKVLFDHQKFSEQKYGGITRYFAALMQGLDQNPDFDYKLAALYSENYYIRNEALPLNNFIGNWLLKGDAKRTYKWNKQYSKRQIAKGDYDILHPTYFHPYYLKRAKKPSVITMHDMIYEALPEYFTNTDITPQHKKQTTEHATAIIAISQSTKNDLMRLLNVPEEKITMIHHGLDLDSALSVEEIPNLPENYLLFVGERGNYKNFFRFAEAAAELMNEYKDLHLVLAGGGPLQVADALIIERLKISTRTKQMNVTDAQLNYLYQQAMVFVFPSLYEGFGYPLLEAFKAGCPVAAGNTSCFPEIGGDAVNYFDPYHTDSIYNSIKQVIENTDQCIDLIAKGNERLKQFTVQKQVEQTLDLYRQVANQ